MVHKNSWFDFPTDTCLKLQEKYKYHLNRWEKTYFLICKVQQKPTNNIHHMHKSDKRICFCSANCSEPTLSAGTLLTYSQCDWCLLPFGYCHKVCSSGLWLRTGHKPICECVFMQNSQYFCLNGNRKLFGNSRVRVFPIKGKKAKVNTKKWKLDHNSSSKCGQLRAAVLAEGSTQFWVYFFFIAQTKNHFALVGKGRKTRSNRGGIINNLFGANQSKLAS